MSVEEEDGAPSVLDISKIKVSNGTLTDNADGTVSFATVSADADYLVGTANGSLSAEIVVGATPGGELGGTWAAPTIDDSLAVTSWTLTTPVITNGATFTDADISPDVAGELVYDNTVAGFDDGLFAWYDDDAIRYLVDLDTLPGDAEDDYVVSYDKDADKFYMKVDATGAGGGDPILVNTVAIGDAAGVDLTSGDVTVTLSVVPSPDTATFGIAADAVDDSHIDWGSGAGQVDLADIPGGISGANVWDFGGATSVKAPTVAGDLTLVSGQYGIDTTQKQFGWHDGTRKVAIASDRKITQKITAGDWDIDSDVWTWEFDTTCYPDGIVITKWTVDANVADPAVELNANLMYCDALAAGAFPGANPVLIDVLDTTTGNSSESTMASSDLGSGIIPAGKIIYVDLDFDPATDTDFFVLQIYFYQPES